MVDFDDTKTAFVTKSNAQLKKAHWLFRLVSSKRLVHLGKYLTEVAIKLRLPIKSTVKKTVYEQFVGGETIQDCTPIIAQLREHGINSLLDYSIEGKETEADFENTKEKIIQTISYGAKIDGVPFAVFKVTGVARFKLLEKVSAEQVLTEEESAEWHRVKERVRAICQHGYDKDISVLIDAEESWIQQAIDKLTREMIQHFNKKKVVVYNTLQMYRTDRLNYLRSAQQLATEGHYYLGVKLVRGAYMEKERARAKEKGYPSPIQPDKAASDRDYDAAVQFVVEHIDNMSLVAGSHNEDSAQKLVDLMEQHGLAHNDPRIWFSQLYGMSDNLSFNLAREGFNVVKYLPFGPIIETLPYLIRRAEENTSAAGQTSRELALIEKELERRGIE